MAITRITGRDGEATAYRPKCRQALEPAVADATADVLSGVFTDGTMRGVGGIGRDAAGKTGTTDGYATAWFAGFTPDLAAAVSIGDPRGSQAHKLAGVTIGGRYYGAVDGAALPGPIWKETMIGALVGSPPQRFTPIDSARFGGVLPGLLGRSPSPRTNPATRSELRGGAERAGVPSPPTGRTVPAGRRRSGPGRRACGRPLGRRGRPRRPRPRRRRTGRSPPRRRA
ncbi:hypothetical protein ACFSTC_13370 [Nonomuraea ferruginea]